MVSKVLKIGKLLGNSKETSIAQYEKDTVYLPLQRFDASEAFSVGSSDDSCRFTYDITCMKLYRLEDPFQDTSQSRNKNTDPIT